MKEIKVLSQIIFILLLVAAGIWIIPKALPGVADQLMKQLPVDCYIGYKGQAASITVSGLAANKVCDSLIRSNAQLYRMSQAPTQPVICERVVQEQRVTVRDEGMLKLIGNQMCKTLDTAR